MEHDYSTLLDTLETVDYMALDYDWQPPVEAIKPDWQPSMDADTFN